MIHFNEIIYKKDLKKLERLGIFKYKTVNEMLNSFHEKLLEIISKNAPLEPFQKERKNCEKNHG